jgi:cation transporter-like permease
MDMKLYKKILKESVKILIFASIVSSAGGIGVEVLKAKIAAIIPLVILLPALNDMIGDFGTVISSKFTTLLYQGKVKRQWWESSELGNEFRVVSSIALFAAFYLSVASVLIAVLQGVPIDIIESLKIVTITFMATTTLVLIIFFLSIIGGLWVYRRGKDPNNFLIPVTTSVADLSSLILLSFLVAFLF